MEYRTVIYYMSFGEAKPQLKDDNTEDCLRRIKSIRVKNISKLLETIYKIKAKYNIKQE